MGLELIQGSWSLACSVPPGEARKLYDEVERALRGSGYQIKGISSDGQTLAIGKPGAGVGHDGNVRVRDRVLSLGGLENAPRELVDELRRALGAHAGRLGYCLIA